MNISEFVKQALDGKIVINGGVVVDGKVIEGIVDLPWSAESITAEAFNQEIFPPDKKWDSALLEVRKLLIEDRNARHDPH